jgi:hypothetical protein
LIPSVLLVAVSAVLLATGWGAITASQPAYLITLVVVIVLALAATAWSLLVRSRSEAKARSRAWVVIRRILGLLGTTVVAVLLVLLAPLAATPVAVAAMESGTGVGVTTTSSVIQLLPAGDVSRTGLVFFPGALVDPRAYVPLLRPLAADGFTVEIVKPPYGIAFLSAGAPNGIIAAHPAIARWVVGGHSLGGVVASSYAGAGHHGIDGLVLWASYPNGNIAGATGLAVTSISASNDGLATPAKIEATRSRLPPTTRFVVVHGANHSDFGDYGTQRGDGVATIPRQQAQRQIEAATLALLERVDRTD